MHLKTAVHDYLDSLSNEDPSIFFFVSKNSNCSLIGSVDGRIVCLLIIENDKKLTKRQIKFSAKIYHSGGEFYCIRSLNDICEIVKTRGWI